MNEPRTTISMTLPQSSIERLEKLRTTMEADSIADVVANALRLFEALVAEAEKKTQFFVRREGSEIEPFEIFS